MQTSLDGSFTRSTTQGWNQIMANEGWNGFYKGLTPLWCRQVPYTVVKFTAFEKTVRMMYAHVFNKKKREEYSKAT